MVAVAALVALLAAVAVTYRITPPGKFESRRYEIGVATTRILVDTPSPQVVAVSPRGSDTLGVRAQLMASLMVDGVVKGLIAKRADIPPRMLVGIAQNDQDGTAPADPPAGRAVNVLTTSVLQDNDGNQLPIIQIQTHAADAAGAARLANAAVDGLHDYLATQAAVGQVPDAKRLRVHSLGAAQAGEVGRGPGMVIGLATGIFLFALGCALILGIAGLIGNLRMPEPTEQRSLRLLESDDAEDDEPAPAAVRGAPKVPPAPGPGWARWDTGGDARSARSS